MNPETRRTIRRAIGRAQLTSVKVAGDRSAMLIRGRAKIYRTPPYGLSSRRCRSRGSSSSKTWTRRTRLALTGGEVNGATYQALGAAGVVANGGVRDLPEVRRTGFQFFSAAILVSHAYVHVVEAGTPVTVGGLTVAPGDLLHGDEHGVTSVPIEIGSRLPDACRAIETAEHRLIDYARSGKATLETLAKIYGEVD